MYPIHQAPCSTVALTISAKKLKDMDVFSKSDPICVVSRFSRRATIGRQLSQPEWREIGRTETIMNCLNPEFTKQIIVEYFFEEKQPLKFEFYDIDNNQKGLDAQDFLGFMECDLAEIVSEGVFSKPLGGLPGNCGIVTIACEEVGENQREHIELNCTAMKLDKKDFFGKSDPFLKIYRMNEDGSRVMIHKTEFIKKTLNPTWKPFELKLSTLSSGDRSRDFCIECWDDNLQFEPDFIGSCQVNVGQLARDKITEIPLINDRKRLKKGKKYKSSGMLVIGARLFVVPTFLDYISGGTQLEFSVAIDFTASNQHPNDPKSLHFISYNPNQYEVAIRAVLEICQYYNRTKQFDAYGFGAIVPGHTGVSHLFSLADPRPVIEDSRVIGVDGVLNAYHTCVRTVRFFGPTNFAPIVQMAARTASTYREGEKYQVLLIVTDGCISDMIPTKKAIVEASRLPLSIIIIGVGTAEFDKMEELDGDNVRISHNGRYADRDIVQFVPINDFLERNIVIPENIMAALAKEVLAELPLQLTSYMRSRNIIPGSSSHIQPGCYEATSAKSTATAPPIDAQDVHITAMEPVAADPHAIKTSNWHSSGTYYVEGKRSYKWVCYVCLFVLLLLISGVAFCVFMYEKQLHEQTNIWFMKEFHSRCGVNGSWSEDELSSYKKYFLSYKGKNITEVCTSLKCYLQNQNTIEIYNNQTEKGVPHFGNTVFSDWCPDRRQSYARPLRSTVAIKAHVNNNEAKYFSQNNGIASKIIFDDQLTFNETVKSALLQWMYYGNKSSASFKIFPTWKSYAKYASNDYDLYDVVKPVEFKKDTDFHKSYLIEEGVFATEVYLNDLAFFYQGGILPRKVCDAPFYDVVKFTVIVLGYGSENGTSYWEVQPVGEQFKLWGSNGTMKIHDTCYKKNHNPRIIDIDLKSRQESAADEGGIPVGKFAMPL